MSTTSGIFGTTSGFLAPLSDSQCAQLHSLDGLKRALQSVYIQGALGSLATTALISLTGQDHAVLSTPTLVAPILSATQSGIPSLIERIRERSALTLEEIAAIMGVSRRSIHNWKNGDPVASGNETSLRELDLALRRLEGRDGTPVREKLMQLRDSGVRVFDLLAEGRYDSAIAIANGSSPIAATTSARDELDSEIASRLDPAAPIKPVRKSRVLSGRLSRGRR